VRAVVYEFADSRAGEHARQFLGDWRDLKDVLKRLPIHRADDIATLLPYC
jgi:hypothetical protein